jgi:hypothetical protein
LVGADGRHDHDEARASIATELLQVGCRGGEEPRGRLLLGLRPSAVSTSQRTEGSPPRQGVKAAIVVEARADVTVRMGSAARSPCALSINSTTISLGGRARRRTEHGAHAN